MRITEINDAPWELRAQRSAAAARDARPATIASELDKDPRDGWIDEDDLPYDQVELLRRARAAEAAAAARERPAAEAPEPAPTPAPPPAAPDQARIDVTAPDGAAAAAQVDLLA